MIKIPYVSLRGRFLPRTLSNSFSLSLDSKIWPRAAALAERLWADPIIADYDEVETRLNAQTKRLTAVGLTPDALRPEWCLINEGNCPNYH